MTLSTQLEKYKNEIEKFKIANVISNEKFVLIEGYISCKMWFCFYEHFIVCSGDYGEYVFDCTWNTVCNGKPIYSLDLHYLLSKLSRDNKKHIFDYYTMLQDVEDWFKEWEEDYYDNVDEDKFEDYVEFESHKDEIKELVCQLKSNIEDEHRRAKVVDEFIEELEDLTEYCCGDYEELYSAGDIVRPQLVINLGILKRISEENLLSEK